MAYVRCFNDKVRQVNDYTDQATLQAAMNGLQPSTFKWEISKIMSKTLSSLLEEAQKHIIAEALYYIGDTRSDKLKIWKNEGGSSGQPQPRSPRSALDREKKVCLNDTCP